MSSTSPGGAERSGGRAPLRSSHPDDSARDRWLALIESLSPSAAHLSAALLVCVVAGLDAVTGRELSFSIFYVIPVALVAWRLGRTAGVVWAVVAGLTWLGIELAGDAGRRALPVQLWNGGVRIGMFLIVAATLAGLRRLWDNEHMLASTDYLTGVLNRRSFHERVELERRRALRYNRPFTLAYLDVDGFKRINDELGHSRGDDVLCLIATTLSENVRNMDTVARLGGDEFALLMPETGPGAAEEALAKIRERLNHAVADHSLPISFSIGAVICVGPPESAERLIQRADSLMYAVKQSGRNSVKMEVLNENFGIQAILQRS